MMGDHERAIADALKVAEEYPDHAVPQYVLGVSAARLGRYDEAIAAHEKMASISPRWLSTLGVTYALAGRTEDALRIVADLESRPPSSWGALGLAELHAAVGHKEEALHWLEYEPRHAWWAGFLGLPAYEILHDEPRYQALVRLVNLPNRPGG